jgi:hypothetical protein
MNGGLEGEEQRAIREQLWVREQVAMGSRVVATSVRKDGSIGYTLAPTGNTWLSEGVERLAKAEAEADLNGENN